VLTSSCVPRNVRLGTLIACKRLKGMQERVQLCFRLYALGGSDKFPQMAVFCIFQLLFFFKLLFIYSHARTLFGLLLPFSCSLLDVCFFHLYVFMGGTRSDSYYERPDVSNSSVRTTDFPVISKWFAD
jgi:hypothetical protein